MCYNPKGNVTKMMKRRKQKDNKFKKLYSSLSFEYIYLTKVIRKKKKRTGVVTNIHCIKLYIPVYNK